MHQMGLTQAYLMGRVQGTTTVEKEFLPLLYSDRQRFLQRSNMQKHVQQQKGKGLLTRNPVPWI